MQRGQELQKGCLGVSKFATETDGESSSSQQRSQVVGEGQRREGRWSGKFCVITLRNKGNTHNDAFESRLQSNFKFRKVSEFLSPEH